MVDDTASAEYDKGASESQQTINQAQGVVATMIKSGGWGPPAFMVRLKRDTSFWGEKYTEFGSASDPMEFYDMIRARVRLYDNGLIRYRFSESVDDGIGMTHVIVRGTTKAPDSLVEKTLSTGTKDPDGIKAAFVSTVTKALEAAKEKCSNSPGKIEVINTIMGEVNDSVGRLTPRAVEKKAQSEETAFLISLDRE